MSVPIDRLGYEGPFPPRHAEDRTDPGITDDTDAFTAAGLTRARHTRDGSREVSWTGVPPEAQTLALLLDDPDTLDGTYLHWIVDDLPPDVTQIAESLGTPHATSPFGGFQAPTASGDLDYSGPCPPDGELHSYQFHVDALDQALDLPQFAPRQDVLAAMEGAIIGHGQFEAGFRRVSRFEENVVFKITPEP
jgi:Raf kinase inhibitor-like YbhB/YbcL family protein